MDILKLIKYFIGALIVSAIIVGYSSIASKVTYVGIILFLLIIAWLSYMHLNSKRPDFTPEKPPTFRNLIKFFIGYVVADLAAEKISPYLILLLYKYVIFKSVNYNLLKWAFVFVILSIAYYITNRLIPENKG